ncbi:mannitol dehydrogenase family protein [Affinibrenneria salicis]|uniref:Mannitol dehydrogenase family protein n=1 Tax=Affinibrenneria salicis TaxID=2590031 RepID=A0A5J5FXQ8_9GAMM|nr:mannitol dehydrogenase family protein [Affinibrenneria salicis]KAA8998884.1 mannitol dehydrogenase family protein [Affinibrenneria salicis]
MRLSAAQLNRLPAGIIRPDYDRSALTTRLFHLGLGAFFRAHQAVYTDTLAARYGSDWGYAAANLRSGQRLVSDLRQQDHLFSVSEMDGQGCATRVVGALRETFYAGADGADAIIAAMARPAIAIVSVTVSEKGYCHQPASGQLDLQHADIQHDLAWPNAPRTLPGVIVAALRLRRQRGLAPFSVMSCDNMPANGRVTHNVITQLAQQQDDALADWIRQRVTFPSTMVDHIVPASTAETQTMAQRQLGLADPAGVVCEPFSQWVIEDNFVSGRPAWELAGAELVRDVLPYEEMKLRMLNGSHSFLAYLGYLAGYPHISDCMRDDAFARAARRLMREEQAPTLKAPGVDLAAYADALLARYRNPALKHRTGQIAMDGSQKLPQRLLDPIRWHLAGNRDFPLLALGVAAWMRYVGGMDERGQPIDISDPLKEELARTVAASAEGATRVAALLSMTAIFSVDLPRNATFVQRVTQSYLSLLADGARETLAAVLQSA